MSRRTFGLRHSDPMLRTPNDADTCRDFVVPALEQSGWTNAPNSVVEQYAYTDGKVAVGARGAVRGRRRIADYLLRVGPDTPLAVVEAKRAGKGMADVRALLFSRFDTLTADADRRPLGEIAPLTR